MVPDPTRPRPERLDWIEASRGIAAITVLIYHAVRHFDKNYSLPALARVVQFGHAGVDLFFVLSGFIILAVHMNDVGRPARLANYVERRLTRIVPTYWCALAISGGLLAVSGHAAPLGVWGMSILPIPASDELIVGVAWTLQFEMVFYAMFAVLILNRNLGMALMLGWLIIIAAAALELVKPSVPWAFYGEFNLEFFGGMAVAYLFRRGPLPWPRTIAGVGLAMLVIAAIAEDAHWIAGYGVLTRFAYGIPCMLLVLSAAEVSRLGTTSVPNFLRVLGSASYSLYLFHFILIGVVWQLLSHAGAIPVIDYRIVCVATIAVAISGGIVISRVIEYPLINLLRGSLQKARSNHVRRKSKPALGI